MSALESIIKWAATLPAWESDAIRRILTQVNFCEIDQEEIIKFIKKEHGLIDSDENIPPPKKLEKGDISGASEKDISICLKSVQCISGINAIPNNSKLPLSPKGLNVIYGDNGSGKSGYARVLKKACRARDTEEDILSNVFSSRTEQATAALSIAINGEDKLIKWKNGEESKSELSNIAVFDSKCARIIIDSKNNAHYLPYGAHVFERLVIELKKIKTRLEREKPLPVKPKIEGIDLKTNAGKLFDQLSKKTKKEDIGKVATWDKSDEEELDNLSKEIINIENNDPLKQASKIRKTQERVEKLAKYLLAIRTKLSNEVELKIKEQIESFAIAEKTLEEASKLTLSDQPLKGAGSNVWQNLYNAAKNYSLEKAYPGKAFPNLEEDSLCVLCMQPLEDKNVKERFQIFKKFMEDTTQQDAEKEKKKLSEIRQIIDEISFYDDEAFGGIFDEISEEDTDLPTAIKSYIVLLKTRKDNFLKLIDEKKYTQLIILLDCPKKEIYNVYNVLGKKAKKLVDSADAEKLIKMKSNLKELEARKLVYNNKDSIIKYIDDLVKEDKYNKCLNAIKILKITTTGRDIVSKALSPQLESALSTELKELGGSKFPVFFKVTGSEGSTKLKLHLKNAITDRKISLSDILSEGEQRVIAIAGFLAELKTSRQRNPIVLDDPVSSLDHRFRRRIAKRLALESKERQVIVFTHDLSFLMRLHEFIEKEVGEIAIKSIERTPHTPGICTDHMPWDAMNVKERIRILLDNCIVLKEKYESMLDSEYEKEAGMLYSNIRETWERLVEELLLNGIVYRFGRDIQTKRLRRVAGDITADDYKKIDEAMTKASNYLHDSSSELHEDMPDPDEILVDIKNIETYRKELGKRNRQARN